MIGCRGCGRELPDDRFAYDKMRRTYRRYKCRECSSAEYRRWKESPGYTIRLAKAREDRARLKRENPKLRWSSYAKPAAKQRAKQRQIPFDLTTEYIFSIVSDRCPLLGIELSYTNKTSLPNSAALDRIDGALGYVHGNVWVISMLANRIKTNASLEQLEMLTKNWRRLVDACVV